VAIPSPPLEALPQTLQPPLKGIPLIIANSPLEYLAAFAIVLAVGVVFGIVLALLGLFHRRAAAIRSPALSS
jgi:ABC-type antimicrobial peptide transport system permease subunit